MILLCLISVLLMGLAPADGAEIGQVNLILDKWTSFHWGEECFVWLLHYPEEIVVPWTELQYRDSSPSEGEKENYRNSFRHQLLMDEAEAFLLSIVPFGNRAVDLEPFSQKMFLIQQGGERVPPISYDEIFDQPMEGKTQGLVFFPKQKGDTFVIQIRGLGMGNNGVFSFPSTYREDTPGERDNIVIMSPGEDLSNLSSEDISTSGVLRTIPESQIPESSMTNDHTTTVDEGQQLFFDNRDELMISFLDSWVAGNYGRMYGHLSPDSRKRLSLAVFTQDMIQSTFRVILMNGYSLKWLDTSRVEVTGNVDMVMMSRLKTRVFTVVEENDGWKISW